MTPADEVAITPAPPPGPAPAPAESPARPAEQRPAAHAVWAPVCFLAAFAGLLASFPIGNSDVLMHLAAGRDVVSGVWPAAPAEAATPAPARTWLYDVLTYGAYSALGAGGLVLLKVLLVIALALVLFRLSRTGPGWVIAAACTALALLAIGVRLPVQPATVSYLFLALTLWLLREGERAETGTAPAPLPPALPPWPLVVLFVAWVNLDSGFLVGLLTVALVGLGRTLDEARAGGPRALLHRGCAFAVLAAACLLGPAHVYAFVPPVDPLNTPLAESYWRAVGLTPAALAYFPLLGLGLLSFLVNLPRWRWRWFLPWAGLAALSAVQARTAIPFFAVVGGPVLAWNLQEAVRGRRGAFARGRLGPLGSFGVLLAACALLVCAWPGWLQAPPFEPRHWGMDLPPSLERAAETASLWYREGKVPPGSAGLHLSAHTVNACAWYCPEEKAVRDVRLRDVILGKAPADEAWAERMRARRIDHVVLYQPNAERLGAALVWLMNDPKQWPLLYLEGDLAVFGWRDPVGRAGRPRDPFRGRELDLNELAFRPAGPKRAPRQPPEREPQPRRWWDAFWQAAPRTSLDRAEAQLYLLQDEALQRLIPYRRVAAWEAGQAAGLVGAAAGWTWPGGPFDCDLRRVLLRPPLTEGQAVPAITQLALECHRLFAAEQEGTPPAVLYLAVRAARRALAEDPQDALAHLALGEGYLRLLRNTRERVWSRKAAQLVQLRRAQASQALNQAIALKPDLRRAHLRLAELYGELNYLDLQLKHLRTYRELARRAAAGPGGAAQDPEAEFFADRQEGRLAAEVEKRQAAYAAEAVRGGVVNRALAAFDRGLAGKARDLLLESDVSAFGQQGMALELELLLRTGRAWDVRDWTKPEQKAALGATQYHWLRAQALAALGDYARAEEELEELGQGEEPWQARQGMALLIGEAILGGGPAGASWFDLPWRARGRMQAFNRIATLTAGLKRWANANVIRGLLALEQGAVDEADVAFRLALSLYRDESAAVSGGGLDFNARPVAEAALGWLQREGP